MGEPKDRAKINRNNRQRGVRYENEGAKIFGGKRHLANTGGPEDIAHPYLSIQVKSGERILREDPIEIGLAKAQQAAQGTDKLACLIAVNRTKNRPLRWRVIFDLNEFVDYRQLEQLAAYLKRYRENAS